MSDRPAIHLRMPQQAEAVAGALPQSGRSLPAAAAPDPRTASQDPVLPVVLPSPGDESALAGENV
jgi:hypothetical protein